MQDPRNLPAEMAVLGTILVDNTQFAKAARVLGADSFFEPLHGRIWGAIERALKAHGTARAVPLLHQVADDLGGLPDDYVVRLANAAICSVEIGPYVAAVHECAIRRRLIELAARMQTTGQDVRDPTLLDQIAALQEEVERLRRAAGRAVEDQDGIGSIAAGFLDGVFDVDILSTGLPRLDEALGGGLHRGRLYALGARTKGYKTTVLLSIGAWLALRRVPVGWIAVELGREKVGRRLWSTIVGVRPAELERREPQAVLAVHRWREANGDPPFWIRDCGALEWPGIEAAIVELIETRQVRVVVVDYWQIIPGGHGNRPAYLAEIAKGLAALAVAHKVTILVAAQLHEDGRTCWGESLEQSADWFGTIHVGQKVLWPDISPAPVPQVWVATKLNRDGERVDAGSETDAPFVIDPRGPRVVEV
jgi:replicative DNA helicase